MNRIKFRREHELLEHNYGIDFTKIKTNEEEMSRLRKMLVQWQKELTRYIDEGSAPIFGYPPICYSPPRSYLGYQKKAAVPADDEKLNLPFLEVFIKHVFKNEANIPSIEDIINAKDEERIRFDDL